MELANGESRSFKCEHFTKSDAILWGKRRETEIADRSIGKIIKRTVKEAFDQYANKVSPLHKGERWERVRLNMLLRYMPSCDIGNVTPADISKLRDDRMEMVTGGSVLREMQLLSSVFEACIEWGYCRDNPVKKTKKPKANKARNRVITDHEIEMVVAALGYADDAIVNTFNRQVAVMFMLALETGMRAGEIASLEWSRVFLDKSFLHLNETKNGVERDVPLSTRAKTLLDKMCGVDDVIVFLVSGQTRDTIFRKARNKAGLSGFTFHDSRHTAATRIANEWILSGGKRGFDLAYLCKMFGWKNPKQAMVYYNPTASDMASRLD